MLRELMRAYFHDPELELEFLGSHRVDHRLARITQAGKPELFVKAFASEGQSAS